MRRTADERGSSTAELVVVFPVLLLLVAAVLQAVVYGLASRALSAAVADAGARARDGVRGPSVAASVCAELETLAGAFVADCRVRVLVAADDVVTVAARARVADILPGLHLEVASTSGGPEGEFRWTG
jgi:Flp pilus assembly protein TadG